jgi:uncharacterized protein (TIGR03437 family)
VVNPQVTVGGKPAEVLFSGVAPGFLGLYQINVRVPGDVAGGTQALLVTAGGQRSNEVKVQIR